MTDPDTWWHIRVGREILDTGRVPATDAWSIAGAGRPWVSQDWLSNVLMAVLHGTGMWGPALVSVVYGLFSVAALWLLWDAISVRRPSIGWLARAAWLLFGLMLAAPVVGARVQVIDLLLGAAVLNLLWRYLAEPRGWHLGALPVVAVAWVNMHAGWPLLFLLGGAVIVGELADRLLRRPTEDPAQPQSDVVRLTVALAVSALVLVLNPNGVAIYLYPFETLGIDALASFIGEWQPARITAPAGQLLAAFVIVGVLPTLLLARRHARTADVLIIVGLTFMATTAVRFLMVAGPIGATVACVVVSPILSSTAIGRAGRSLLARLERPGTGWRRVLNSVLLSLVILIGIWVAYTRIAPTGQARAIGEVLPVDAVEWMQREEPGVRVFNRYEWGGYLGLSRQQLPVFIDGRADVYGDAIIREYIEVISVNVDPDGYFARHRIDHVLYPPDSTLGRWLDGSDSWRSVYEDEVASVWVRD